MTTVTKLRPTSTGEGASMHLDEDVYKPLALVLDLSGDEDAAWEIWHAEGHKVNQLQKGSQFWLGDWYLAGEEKFGEKAAGFFENEAYDEITLSQYTRVALAFKPKYRRAELSWTHHKIAAPLPTVEERNKALKWAIKQQASTRALQDYVNSRLATDEDEADTPDDPAPKNRAHYRVSFEVPASAEAQGEQIMEIAVAAVEEAARSVGVELLNIEHAKS